MTKFVYNNAKNTNIDYTQFDCNYSYYLCISFEKKSDPQSKLQLANIMAKNQAKS